MEQFHRIFYSIDLQLSELNLDTAHHCESGHGATIHNLIMLVKQVIKLQERSYIHFRMEGISSAQIEQGIALSASIGCTGVETPDSVRF